MEEPVSEPMSKNDRPVQTAAALPPEDPPGVRARFRGLRIGRKYR